jgi:hypothetical protein
MIWIAAIYCTRVAPNTDLAAPPEPWFRAAREAGWWALAFHEFEKSELI